MIDGVIRGHDYSPRCGHRARELRCALRQAGHLPPHWSARRSRHAVRRARLPAVPLAVCDDWMEIGRSASAFQTVAQIGGIVALRERPYLKIQFFGLVAFAGAEEDNSSAPRQAR